MKDKILTTNNMPYKCSKCY